MKSKKVLFIHHGKIAGGAPLSMLYTMQGVRERGYNIIVGLVSPIPELHELYNKNGFQTFPMSWIPVFLTWSGSEGKRWNPVMWRNAYSAYSRWKTAKKKLLEFVEKHKVDLIHLNSAGLSNPAAALLDNNLPFVWHVREHGPSHKGRRFNFIAEKLKIAKAVIFLSKAEQKSWTASNNHGTVVHNFIDFDKFDFQLSKAVNHQQFGLENDCKILLYVGGSKLHKGIIPLLYALAIVKKKYKGKFVCLMPDTLIPENGNITPEQRKIRSIIKAENIDNICQLMPFNPDIIDLFAVCDILAFPATKPHFARPIIEASAMKKPVIASNLPAIDELVLPNKTGYLVPESDHQMLAEKIIYLFENPEVCQEMGEEGYKFAQDQFEFNKQIDKIEQIYLRLLK